MADRGTTQRGRDSTTPKDNGDDATHIDLVYRRILVGLIAVVAVVGVTGFLGVKETEKLASGQGYELAVRYASVTRPGLATPFDVTVSRAEGLPGTVGIEVTSDYLGAFDENGLSPEPDTSFSDGEVERWSFDVPTGEDVLVVSFDARLEPSVQWSRSATIALLIGDEVVTEVEVTTWVMP